MRKRQDKLITFQILCVLGFNYFIWKDTLSPDQTSVCGPLMFIIGLFNALVFGLIIYTFHQKDITKHKSGFIMDLNMLFIAFMVFLSAANNCLVQSSSLGVNYALMLMALFASAFLFFEARESYSKATCNE